MDWNRLGASGANLSLFASKRLVEIRVPSAASREHIEAVAMADETVQKFVNGQKPKKVVVVPGRLVNVVV